MNTLAAELRNARMMVNYGHGDARDEPDPLHEEAAKWIEQLEAENAQLEAALREVDDKTFDPIASRIARAALARNRANFAPAQEGDDA
jgi:hypothetical protein